MSAREVITSLVDRYAGTYSASDSGNAPTLLMIGTFKFSINTAAFQEMQRSTSWRWPAQERVGQLDALQHTGPGEDRMTLPGVIYPDFRGGAMQLDELRALAAKGQPQRLISAAGDMLGRWVILSVEETASGFKVDGSPRKQEFTVTMRKFADADL